ncbi:MAG: 5'/3'-nucleotidase SurE [Desulfatitalea sp.]|nr:5'/3'-nucleotidase SurE [Desulfatitalea sp.]MBI5895296.1 5'/3'-nucleotidase SurE [Desulfobacterales bacterium]
MTILLTNDDGIHAPGLWALHRALKSEHELIVVAPERERSAVGHGITLHKPLRAYKVTINAGDEGWAVTGTPADCVKLSMVELLDQHPDLVISGINPGANVGVNLNYSGTVAAAKEAALYGVPALAVSVQSPENPHFDDAAGFVARLVRRVRDRGLPSGVFLNVNIPNLPADEVAGVKITRQGCDLYDEYFEKRRDPRNRVYYWQGYESQPTYTQDDADGAVLAEKYITITPVRCDMTDYSMMEQLHAWDLKKD